MGSTRSRRTPVGSWHNAITEDLTDDIPGSDFLQVSGDPSELFLLFGGQGDCRSGFRLVDFEF